MAAKPYPFISGNEDFIPDEVAKKYKSQSSEVQEVGNIKDFPTFWYNGILFSPKGLLICSEKDFKEYDFLSERMGEKEKYNAVNEDGVSLSNFWDKFDGKRETYIPLRKIS